MLNKLKQIKDIRSEAKKLQGMLAEESITVKAAGDKILLTMDGNLAITGLAIDDDLLDPSQKEKLQDGLKKAFAEAQKKIQRVMAMKMKDMGGFGNLPGLS
ncbi:YbaB/EbfC family nucleoid-associated protein [Patescibacteria group bacterium]|nr:YbaB/EbfC family nucleoid-associated protein [Patescibacteria group bacterium]MBU1721416.1 YbaB/EbfC family nucleoid-associated protein [Patescibacteria group bacterium]MBU1901856.1 YbaB/EbfC family nucleoid-associated protein [Patescibacteria group bacterium]